MRRTEKHSRIMIVRNILGGILIYLINQPFYYWGNLAIYVTSYTLNHVTSSDDGLVKPSWTYAFFTPFWVMALMTSGYLSKHVNPRILIGLAISFHGMAFFVSYFLIDVSITSVYIMFGVFSGLGCGFYEGILMQHFILNLSERHASLFTSTVMSGGPIGAIVINQFVTWYTNSQNLPPTARCGSMDIFTQSEVITKVPTLLLLLGCGFVTIQFIGLFLLGEVVPASFKEETKYFERVNQIENYQSITPSPASSSKQTLQSSSSSSPATATTTRPNYDEERTDNQYNEDSPPPLRKIPADIMRPNTDIDTTNNPTTTNNATNTTATNNATNTTTTNNNSYTPREMIRSSNFYKLSVICALGFSAKLVVFSYYKLYGQVWISDDHFLTNLGSAEALLEIPAIIFWGYLIDRIGVTSSLAFMFSGSALSLLLMYFTARFNRWAYFVSTLCALWMININTSVGLATFHWFGRENYSINIGILDMASTPGMVIPTLVLDSLIAKFGHFLEFGWAAVSCVLGLIIIAVSFPRT